MDLDFTSERKIALLLGYAEILPPFCPEFCPEFCPQFFMKNTEFPLYYIIYIYKKEIGAEGQDDFCENILRAPALGSLPLCPWRTKNIKT